MRMKHSLIRAEDSILIVIDVQDNFLTKLVPAQSQEILDRIAWLVGVANWLSIPVIVTVEDLRKVPGPSQQLQRALTPDTPVLDKMVFGLADQPDILATVIKTERKTAVLVGLETDVCVTHSALGLASRDFRVIVLSDATCSPGAAHEAGLGRIREAGVLVTSIKGIFYEWMRTVEQTRRFDAECPTHVPPKGLEL
jgi:nicotinamidase-related amidase